MVTSPASLLCLSLTFSLRRLLAVFCSWLCKVNKTARLSLSSMQKTPVIRGNEGSTRNITCFILAHQDSSSGHMDDDLNAPEGKEVVLSVLTTTQANKCTLKSLDSAEELHCTASHRVGYAYLLKLRFNQILVSLIYKK